MQKSKILLLILIASAISLTGAMCSKGPSQKELDAIKPITIKWWRVFDDESDMKPIIAAYKAIHPNVSIEYRKIRFDTYENELLNALAEDRGPDIISIHNTWMPKYISKLSPLPPSLEIPFSEIKGIKKQVITTIRTIPTISPRVFKEQFVDAVASDVLINNRTEDGNTNELIFGLPFAMDTLALYVNKDLLNLSGIAEVPKTWSEMQTAVKKLTKFNDKGEIIQSGAALGGSHNIERASDVLALLMMQNGAEMIDSRGRAGFDKIPSLMQGRPAPPGEEALVFYTDFANPQKEVYTWSQSETNSLEAFAAGRTAMLFGYSYHLPTIKAHAPRFVNMAIAKVPQIEGNPEVNFANYWIEGVSRKSTHQNWAWDFLQFATSPTQVSSYLNATGRPTALRSLISSQLENEETNAFASQVLTAKHWYKGANIGAAENVLLDAIDGILNGLEPSEVIKTAVLQVNQTLR